MEPTALRCGSGGSLRSPAAIMMMRCGSLLKRYAANHSLMEANLPQVAQQILTAMRLTIDDDILVFDPGRQPTLPEKVRLFSVNQQGWRIFMSDRVRRHLKRLTDPEVLLQASKAYTDFIQGEDEREQHQRARRAALSAKQRAEYEAWEKTIVELSHGPLPPYGVVRDTYLKCPTGMVSIPYGSLLRTREWANRRKEIKERDGWMCRECRATADEGALLHVHHRQYRVGLLPWQYPDDSLITLCENCHWEIHDSWLT
jgi:hypothetical protein